MEKKRTDFILVGPVLLNVPNLPVFLLYMFLEVVLGVLKYTLCCLQILV